MKFILLIPILLLPVQVDAAKYAWICEGVIANGYSATHPEYRELRPAAKHVLVIQCPFLHYLRSKPCEANVDGRHFKDVWYLKSGLTVIDNLGITGANFDAETGSLSYMQTEDRTAHAKKQRWFVAHCSKR